jgi:phage gpG-like protein
MLKVQLVGDKELIIRLGKIPATMQAALLRAVSSLTLRLETLVKQKLTGQVLNVRTGALRRSIFSTVDSNVSGVIGRVASAGDVKYAAIHEFGGTTPAHDIFPVKASALHFFMGGKEVFAKVVHHPGSRMPERSYLRSSLADMAPTIEAELRAAAVEGIHA